MYSFVLNNVSTGIIRRLPFAYFQILQHVHLPGAKSSLHCFRAHCCKSPTSPAITRLLCVSLGWKVMPAIDHGTVDCGHALESRWHQYVRPVNWPRLTSAWKPRRQFTHVITWPPCDIVIR